MAFLLFVISFLVPEILKFSYYANLVTDDIISCASTAVWHKIKNISANNEAMLLKLRRNVAPYEIYQMVHIVMLLWQHAQFQSLLLKNQILPFVATRDKINMSVKNAKEEILWRYFALVSHKWLNFILKRQETGTKHGAIATLKCVPRGIFRRMQHPCQVSTALLHYYFVSHHCTYTTNDVISDYICIIGKLQYLWNKKGYDKKKNAILFYFEKPFKY